MKQYAESYICARNVQFVILNTRVRCCVQLHRSIKTPLKYHCAVYYTHFRFEDLHPDFVPGVCIYTFPDS